MFARIAPTRTPGLLALLVVACATPALEPPGTEAPAPTESASVASPAAPAPPSPAVTASPAPTPGPTVRDPVVALDPAPIPILRTLALRAPPIDDAARAAARSGLEEYLRRLDWYRQGAMQLPVSGAFGEAVRKGIEASTKPGIKRAFVLESIDVELYLVKPWGIPALAEVRVTIADRAVEGSAPEERETGRLRLMGDRLSVVDGWDAANGRWFNGPEPGLSEAALRERIVWPLQFFLRLETWLPGSAVETGFGPGTSPFWASRHEYVKSFDRTKTVARRFSHVTARIEKFETFPEVPHGLATVRIGGTVVTVDVSGSEHRTPMDRRVVVLIGNWGPEVVDEEISAGVWRSGGDLALKERDRNFA